MRHHPQTLARVAILVARVAGVARRGVGDAVALPLAPGADPVRDGGEAGGEAVAAEVGDCCVFQAVEFKHRDVGAGGGAGDRDGGARGDGALGFGGVGVAGETCGLVIWLVLSWISCVRGESASLEGH